MLKKYPRACDTQKNNRLFQMGVLFYMHLKGLCILYTYTFNKAWGWCPSIFGGFQAVSNICVMWTKFDPKYFWCFHSYAFQLHNVGRCHSYCAGVDHNICCFVPTFPKPFKLTRIVLFTNKAMFIPIKYCISLTWTPTQVTPSFYCPNIYLCVLYIRPAVYCMFG